MGGGPVNLPNERIFGVLKLFKRTYVPLNLSSIHEEGAARRFKCFLGPRA
jgi:hypothetical protein